MVRTERPIALAERSQLVALHEWLRSQGVTGPETGADEEDDGLRVGYDEATGTVAIDADRDVGSLLDDWAPPPGRDAIARAVVVATVRAIAAKPPATRTGLENWMLGVSWLALRIDAEATE